MVILFYDAQNEYQFLLTAPTCINQLLLPQGRLTEAVLPAVKLFDVYDHVFASNHFGII